MQKRKQRSIGLISLIAAAVLAAPMLSEPPIIEEASASHDQQPAVDAFQGINPFDIPFDSTQPAAPSAVPAIDDEASGLAESSHVGPDDSAAPDSEDSATGSGAPSTSPFFNEGPLVGDPETVAPDAESEWPINAADGSACAGGICAVPRQRASAGSGSSARGGIWFPGKRWVQGRRGRRCR